MKELVCLEIALHKKESVMKEKGKSVYVKRTQKDYSLFFKLQVVKEIEHGSFNTTTVQRK